MILLEVIVMSRKERKYMSSNSKPINFNKLKPEAGMNSVFKTTINHITDGAQELMNALYEGIDSKDLPGDIIEELKLIRVEFNEACDGLALLKDEDYSDEDLVKKYFEVFGEVENIGIHKVYTSIQDMNAKKKTNFGIRFEEFAAVLIKFEDIKGKLKGGAKSEDSSIKKLTEIADKIDTASVDVLKALLKETEELLNNDKENSFIKSVMNMITLKLAISSEEIEEIRSVNEKVIKEKTKQSKKEKEMTDIVETANNLTNKTESNKWIPSTVAGLVAVGVNGVSMVLSGDYSVRNIGVTVGAGVVAASIQYAVQSYLLDGQGTVVNSASAAVIGGVVGFGSKFANDTLFQNVKETIPAIL